jgi:hypothetical protein
MSMLYKVIEETWSISFVDNERKLLNRSGPLFAGEREAAEAYAEQRASEFDRHGVHDELDGRYRWGRGEHDRENHRFIVKPAVSTDNVAEMALATQSK